MIYLFNDKKQLNKIIPRNNIIEAVQTIELNGLYTFYMELPLFYKTNKGQLFNHKKSVDNATFIGHFDKQDRFQLYKIHDRIVQDDNLIVEGVHLFFDEALAGDIIRDKRPTDDTVDVACDVAFNGIGWQVSEYDVTPLKSTNFYYESPAECRKKIIETWNVELDYSLTFDGQKIVSKNIHVKNKLGEWTGKRFAYGSNVLQIKQEQSDAEIVTAVIGRGKGEEVGDGYGRRINLANMNWSNDVVTKPYAQDYIELPSATEQYGYYENGVLKPRLQVAIFEDIEGRTELAKATYEYLIQNCVPKVSYETDVISVGDLNLGDEVGIIYKEVDILRKARVQKLEVNLLNTDLTKISLGDYQYFKEDKAKINLQKKIDRVEKDTLDYITQLKLAFDTEYNAQTDYINQKFNEALDTAQAEVIAAETRMNNTLDTTRTELESDISTAKQDAITQAETNAKSLTDSVRTDLDNAKTRIDTSLSDLGNDISAVDTKVVDVSNDLATKVDKSIYDTAINDLKNADSNMATKIDKTDEKISLTATKIDNLSVGGRNLLEDSDKVVTQSSREHMYYADILPALKKLNVGDEITISFDVEMTKGQYLRIYNSNRRGVRYIVGHTFKDIGTQKRRLSFQDTVREDTSKTSSHSFLEFYSIYDSGDFATVSNVKIEKGNIATDWTPAVEDTVQHSEVKLLSDGFSIGTTKVGGDTFASAIVGNKNGLALIGDNVDVSNNLTVKNTITSEAIKAVRGDFANVTTAYLTSNIIDTNMLKSEVVDASKLKVDSALVNKLSANSIFANDIKTKAINAVHADLKSVSSEIMTANIIKSDWLDVDTALFDRITSSEAFIDRLEVKASNIRDLTATDIKGGVLSSLNNSMKFNLMSNHLEFNNDATIDFYSKKNAFRMFTDSSTTDPRDIIHALGTGTSRTGYGQMFLGGGHYDIDGNVKANDIGFSGLKLVGNSSYLSGSKILIGSGGDINQDQFFEFDFTTSLSNRYAYFRPSNTSDNFIIGSSYRWFHSMYTWRLNGLRFYNPSGYIKMGYDNGSGTGASLRFYEDDIWFDRGGTFSLKRTITRANNNHDSINSSNGILSQLKSLAYRVSVLENK